MKIGFDVSQTCQERAGCAWYADSLAQAMIRYAPEHEYILYHQFANWINNETSRGTHSPHKNVASPFLKKSHSQSTNAWDKILAGKTLPGTPDIVHSTSFQAPKLSKTKLVFTIYDLSFWIVPEYTTEANRLACQKGLLQALRHASGFAFISESTRNEFEKLFPGWLEESGTPWAVTPLGARARVTATLPFQLAKHHLHNGGYWLSVGSLEPRKNITVLLDAHQAYLERSQQRLPLVIAGGSGWKSHDIQQRIARLAKVGSVVPVGYVKDAELPSLYKNAAALVFPTLYEGFGLPILEAFNNACPVISAKHTSLTEVAGDACLEINPRDSASLCEAMLKLEASPLLCAELKAAGNLQAAKFTWEITAAETLRLYDRVLTQPRTV
jgi:glycosyltransferase involved in cell wall biosynthesis